MRKSLGTLFVCFFILLFGRLGLGQSTTGSIYGTVADASGAVVPGALVTAKEIRTAVTQTQTTNSSGEYVFPTLNPGDYTVTATALGFKAVIQTGVTLASNQNAHVVFSVVAGGTNETVQVEAGVTLVDTRESQVGTTIEQKRIQDLPTLNRNPYDLVLITPGVSSYTPDQQTGSRNGTKFVVNGLPSDMVSNYLDGAYINSFKQGGGDKIPNPDAIQEFRILTSNFDAEFGRSPGAVVNVLTRGGTGNFHGSAYDYVRNDRLRAQPYFSSGAIQPYKQNQFGGTVGGPIALLKQTFFFTSYEQLILHQVAYINGLLTPTALERQGNFSEAAKLGKTVPTLPAGTNCGTTMAPIICRAALDQVAQAVLAYVPVGAPASAGSSAYETAAQQTASNNTSNYQGLGRIDYNGIENHSIEGMFFNDQGTVTNPTAGGNQILPYGGMIQTENQIDAVVADTWTLNPRAVNAFRGFYVDNKYVIANLHQNQFFADLGSQAGEGGSIFAPPAFTVSGLFTAGGVGAGPSNISQIEFGGIDTLNLTRGNHSIKLGGSYVWNRYTEDGAAAAGANMTFSASAATGGTPLAAFLLGRASVLNQSSSISHRTHAYDPALYVQDDWLITPRLTINAGVRWEMFPQQCCEPQLLGTFYAGQQSTVIPSAPVGILYQGDAGVPLGLLNTSLRNFSPRLGFADDVFGNGRMSVRGGFGLFYQTIEQYYIGTATQLPFSLTSAVNNTPNLVCPYGGGSGCPAGTPAGSDPYPFAFNAAAPRFADNAVTQSFTRGTGTPYVYEYNFGIEQQIGQNFAFHIGYIGNATRRNIIQIDTNAPLYLPNADNSTNGIDCRRPYEPYRDGGPANYTSPKYCSYSGYQGAPATFSNNGALATAYAGMRFGAINERVPADNANYNSLQADLRGHVGQKLDIFATYVWSKSLAYDGPTVDNHNMKLNYGVTDADVRNRFTVSALVHLPTPKSGGLLARQVLGGWQVNDITTLQSGSPFTVTSGVDTNRDGANNDRVNIVGQPYSASHSRYDKIHNGILNVNAFSTPGFTLPTDNPYGNEQRDQLFGPIDVNTNLSLFKDFSVYRDVRFQFRAEAFNAIGNVNLGLPRTVFSNFRGLTPGPSTQFITGYATNADSRIFQFAGKLLF